MAAQPDVTSVVADEDDACGLFFAVEQWTISSTPARRCTPSHRPPSERPVPQGGRTRAALVLGGPSGGAGGGLAGGWRPSARRGCAGRIRRGPRRSRGRRFTARGSRPRQGHRWRRRTTLPMSVRSIIHNRWPVRAESGQLAAHASAFVTNDWGRSSHCCYVGLSTTGADSFSGGRAASDTGTPSTTSTRTTSRT
jgi:hypothetical protein